MNTLVQTPETNVQAARDRLRNHQERFEELSREMKVSQICESAGFIKKVSIGQYFRNIHDVDDGFGGKTGSCRKFSLPRNHQDSEPFGWIRGHTRIGPVHQTRVTCCLDQHGDTGTVYVEWMNLGMTKMTLTITLKWRVLQAWSNNTQ